MSFGVGFKLQVLPLMCTINAHNISGVRSQIVIIVNYVCTLRENKTSMKSFSKISVVRRRTEIVDLTTYAFDLQPIFECCCRNIHKKQTYSVIFGNCLSLSRFLAYIMTVNKIIMKYFSKICLLEQTIGPTDHG